MKKKTPIVIRDEKQIKLIHSALHLYRETIQHLILWSDADDGIKLHLTDPKEIEKVRKVFAEWLYD